MTDSMVAGFDAVSHRYATVALDDAAGRSRRARWSGSSGRTASASRPCWRAYFRRAHGAERKGHRFRRRYDQAVAPRTAGARRLYAARSGPQYYPTLSVFENIDFFGRLFGQSAAGRRTKITELLTATALDPFEDRPAGELLRGHEAETQPVLRTDQRSGIAGIGQSTTGVDPLSRGQFWDLINTIRARRPSRSA